MGKFHKIHVLLPLVSFLNIASYFLKKYSLFIKENKHPIIYINCYSLSLSFSFILLIIKKILSKRITNNNIVLANITKSLSNLSQRQTTKTKKLLWILLVSIIDFIGIVLSSIFWLDAVDTINAWAFDILTLFLSYCFILKKRLYKHHFLSIFIIIITGTIIVFIREAKHGKSNLINYLNHVLFSFTHVIYKYLMLTKLIKYYEMLFIEGIIELVLGIITLIITTNIGYIDNFWDFINYLDGTKVALIIVNIILEFFCNFLKLLIIDLYSPLHVFLIYLYADILFYLRYGISEGLANYIAIVILSLICVFAMMIYLERLELNFCGMSTMLKKNIELRAEQESISSIEDIKDDEKDINIKGYSIELINENKEDIENEKIFKKLLSLVYIFKYISYL